MIGGEFSQAHRAAGVKLVSGDADFRPKAEFAAIRKPRRDVVENTRRINLAQEPLGRGRVIGDDAIGVMRQVEELTHEIEDKL